MKAQRDNLRALFLSNDHKHAKATADLERPLVRTATFWKRYEGRESSNELGTEARHSASEQTTRMHPNTAVSVRFIVIKELVVYQVFVVGSAARFFRGKESWATF